jgi:hypothetical protein
MRATSSFVILGFELAMGVFVVGSAAYAEIGRGTLVVQEAPWNYDSVFFLQIGVTYVVTIEGVSSTEVGNPAPATIPVWVKSSFGNTMHTATLRGSYCGFRYTPSAIACGTAIVSYGNGPEGGYDARALCWGPEWACDISLAPGRLRYVNNSGAEIPCPPTAVEDAPWSSIKKLYQ